MRQRKLMNPELSQRILASILIGLPDPVMVFDGQEKLVLMNPAAEGLFGASTVGTTAQALFRSDDLSDFVTRGETLPEWTAPDGRVFVPRLETVTGDQSASILVLRDVTQFKKVSRNQAEFMRIVSHDIRSPLTYIQGFANMLAMVGPVNERQEHFVEKVLSGIAQITSLVDNIQDAGRFDIETGFYEMSRDQCDLHEIVQRIVQNHLVPAEKGELTISAEVASNIPIINADRTMLERALTNLVDNAIKYTPNGGQVRVTAYTADNSVILAVSDTGYGISPENQKLLFQRHVRLARQEHKKVKGSGLGLFIVKSAAQRHGGDAWVESAEGKGSTFYFSIPLKGDNLVVRN
jgi:signal transduction histidine kinase